MSQIGQEKQPTAFLIDASIFVFRSYYSKSDELLDVNGQSVNAIYGFGRFLSRFLAQTQAQYVACAFDEALTTTFRNEIYPPYKANREPAPDDLKRQFKGCRKLADHLGIATFGDDHYEADDLIGTLHARYARKGLNVCVVSADKDLAQLVRPTDWWWDYGKNKPLGYQALTKKFGVRPDQIVDFLALAGDSVDNIPGVKGVGPKTAVSLLKYFGDLDNVINRSQEIAYLSFRGAKSCAMKIKQQADQAYLSRQLTQIVLDAPMTNDDIIKKQGDESALQDCFNQMNFGPMMRRQLIEAAKL